MCVKAKASINVRAVPGLTWWPHGFGNKESQVTQHTTRFKGGGFFFFTLMWIRSELQQYFGKGAIIVFMEKSSWLKFSTHLYYFISIFSCWAGFAPQENPMKMENLTSIHCTYIPTLYGQTNANTLPNDWVQVFPMKGTGNTTAQHQRPRVPLTGQDFLHRAEVF